MREAGRVVARTLEAVKAAVRPGVSLREGDVLSVTRDGSRSAHFEHTVAITADGPRVLTLP